MDATSSSDMAEWSIRRLAEIVLRQWEEQEESNAMEA